ncbi:MAG: hypothetical protein FWB91_01500 [Defluviitaleaceae bacterium]|nr:hypothetical protein [Defluviitaleaceae bacterium]
MASAVSYEYLKAIKGAPNGIPGLDENGQIPTTQLPISSLLFLGQYATEAELVEVYASAELANYAFVDETTSFWYWNAGLTTPAWVNQEITDEDYEQLSDIEKSMVPYLIVPTPETPPDPEP